MAATSSEAGSPVHRKVSLHDRIAFLMSIKEEGKAVTFDHIVEKVTRDLTSLGEAEPTEKAYGDALSSLAKEGLVNKEGKGFYPGTGLGRYVSGFVGDSRELLNRSYYLVYAAERYYPSVMDTMLPYLLNRPLSAIKVFSGKRDPIKEVEPIFVRYSKYKPRRVHLTVENGAGVMDLIHDHCVDFVPYVHGFDGRADIFLVDLDLGSSLAAAPEGLSLARRVALETFCIMKERGCHPLPKFSGSRGFQLLCALSHGGRKVSFEQLRASVKGVQRELESRLRSSEIGREHPSLGIDEPFTTSSVDARADRSRKVLVDWSSMKPEGDYRAPFSIHYKTGLVSLPLKESQLLGFEKEMADPFRVRERNKDFTFARDLPYTDPEAILSFVDVATPSS